MATMNRLAVGDLVYTTANNFEVNGEIIGKAVASKSDWGIYTIYSVTKVSNTKYILTVQYDTTNIITIVREASSDTNDDPSSSSGIIVKP